MGRFWTLERISITLQLALFVVVVAVLFVSMLTMNLQNRGFAQVAEERATTAEISQTRLGEAVETLTCIILIPEADRTTETVQECGTLLTIPMEPSP